MIARAGHWLCPRSDQAVAIRFLGHRQRHWVHQRLRPTPQTQHTAGWVNAKNIKEKQVDTHFHDFKFTLDLIVITILFESMFQLIDLCHL